MISFLFFLVSILCSAETPYYWHHAIGIQDRHEFYKDSEIITTPKDSWQTLFSVVYVNKELVQSKDCVYFRVPGSDPGIIKIKTIASLENCDEYVLSSGDREVNDIQSLQFSMSPKNLMLEMTFKNYKNEKWEVQIQSEFKRLPPKILQSSAEYKSPKIIFLAPTHLTHGTKPKINIKSDSICHEINDDCQEVSPSRCGACSEGWYEIPNGCLQGPKYCGRSKCGQKNSPACRRGMKWQREDINFDCQMNSSFAYCAKGLSIQCQGRMAYCR